MGLDSFEKDGITYFELYISCPVCLDRGNITPQSYWYHGDDGCNGDLYIGSNALVLCKKCRATAMLKDVTYGCPLHSDKDTCEHMYFKHKNSILTIESLRLFSSMVQVTGINWTQTLFENAFTKE